MHYEIHERDGYSQLEINLDNDSVKAALTKVHYTLGQFDITSLDDPSLFKRVALFYQQQASMKPQIHGKGKVLFKTTAYKIVKLELENQSLFIKPGLFLASSAALKLEPYTIHSPLKRMVGEPKHQTKISGSGILFLLSPGPLTCIELDKQILKTPIPLVARETSTQFSKSPWTQAGNVQLNEVKAEVQWIKGPGKVYLPEYVDKEVILYRHITRSAPF